MPVARAPADLRPLYEIIAVVLREHLVDGSFLAGLVLGEAGVARAFKSSRIPAAAALRTLSAEGLIKKFDGRGYLAVDADPRTALRRELTDAGLRLPETVSGSLETPNHQVRIYPLVEHAVAASLSYGRFLVNQSALAEHFSVSRTVAHEVPTLPRAHRAHRKGQEPRWYAGPLTVDRLREHFEMRWLLEPPALGQAIETLSPAKLLAKRERVKKAQRHRTLLAGLSGSKSTCTGMWCSLARICSYATPSGATRCRSSRPTRPLPSSRMSRKSERCLLSTARSMISFLRGRKKRRWRRSRLTSAARSNPTSGG